MKNRTEGTEKKLIAPSQNEQQIIGRPDVPTLFIDRFMFAKRSDGYIIASGVQDIPNACVEQMRFMITEDHAKCFLDRLANILDYFPMKDKQQMPMAKFDAKGTASEKKNDCNTRKASEQEKANFKII